MEITEDLIHSAIVSGEVIKIKYQGGSQPGAIREIAPRSVSGDRVRALCLATSRIKTFMLSKMELLQAESTGTYNPDFVKPEFSSLSEGLEHYKQALEIEGRVMKYDDREAGIYRCFKNGSLRKTPDVCIQFHEMTYDYTDVDDDGNLVDVMKANTRPWYVRSNLSGSTSTFSVLSGAIEKFVEFANDAVNRQ